MVKGTIINKFRGDVEILRPGLAQLEALTSVPVLGVVPWLDLDLDDEDSLSSRFSARRAGAPLDAAVVRLPRISNFTDFNALERHPAVGLRYAARVEELGPGLLSVVIHEGRNRQVRRMCALAGLEVTRLKRIREGDLWLDRSLKPGQWRPLTAEELALLGGKPKI